MIKKYLLWFKNGTIAWITLSHGSRPRRVIKAILMALIATILKREFLKTKILAVLNHFPKLKHRLKQIKNVGYAEQIPLTLTHLNACQRDIFMMMKNAKGKNL